VTPFYLVSGTGLNNIVDAAPNANRDRQIDALRVSMLGARGMRREAEMEAVAGAAAKDGGGQRREGGSMHCRCTRC
jgi:hypothetical protein